MDLTALVKDLFRKLYGVYMKEQTMKTQFGELST